MENYDLNRIPALKALQELGRRQKEETDALSKRVDDLEDAGGQPNKIEVIKVNGVTQGVAADKSVDLTMPTKVSDLTNDKKYQTDAEVTDTVSKAVAAADHLKRKIVESAEAIDVGAADAAQYIYMVPKGTAEEADKYDEYMVIDGVLEKMGDWGVDLSDYVAKEEGKGLSSNDFTDDYKQQLDGMSQTIDESGHPHGHGR